MKTYSILRLLNSSIQLWQRLTSSNLCLNVSLFEASKPFGTMLRFNLISSKSYYNNQILLDTCYISTCAFMFFNKHLILIFQPFHLHLSGPQLFVGHVQGQLHGLPICLLLLKGLLHRSLFQVYQTHNLTDFNKPIVQF